MHGAAPLPLLVPSWRGADLGTGTTLYLLFSEIGPVNSASAYQL